MNDHAMDRALRIQTTGMRESLNQSVHYNRYEATPYIALDALFSDYKLTKADEVVDFGCGKGRFSFYAHHLFKVTVTGIEMNGQLYQEALKNQADYMQKGKGSADSIVFEQCLAEEYEVRPSENRFYFFNPFSVQIFMKVIHNILLSVEQYERSIDIILYYPTIEYTEFLETSTSFELFEEVTVPNFYEINDKERFLIFRFEI